MAQLSIGWLSPAVIRLNWYALFPLDRETGAVTHDYSDGVSLVYSKFLCKFKLKLRTSA